ncbi:exosome complex protein Rrp42 [Candidatus Micrarchaeota archaeon]|nr:exosome complex protein Rrp42 [Candidatus Micrarchaeota archaeon]
MILDEVKEAFIKDLLLKGKRVDGRDFMQYREISVEKNFLPNDEGGAIARIGDSKVVAAVKFDLLAPFPDRPTEGVFMVNSEFSPVAHPDFESGPPNPNSIELARVVDRGIRSAGTIDLDELGKTGIPGEKVMAVFVDLHIIDHSGNLIDCAALAAAAALASAKKPKFEDGAIVRGEYEGKFQLKNTVVSSSFEKIGGKIIIDATHEEEVASSGRVTIATADDEHVCAVQKSGAAGFSEAELLALIDAAFEKRSELLKYV